MSIIQPDYPLASWFLVVSTLFFLVVYALPLLLIPLRWARWFAWEVQPGNTDLTVYFGRCLGGVALAIVIAVGRAIPDPSSHKMLFELVGLATGMMTLVHIWGALRRAQPWTETAEIGFYGAVSATAFWIRLFTLP